MIIKSEVSSKLAYGIEMYPASDSSHVDLSKSLTFQDISKKGLTCEEYILSDCECETTVSRKDDLFFFGIKLHDKTRYFASQSPDIQKLVNMLIHEDDNPPKAGFLDFDTKLFPHINDINIDVKEKDEAKTTLEQMKIETMFRMVDHVTVESDGAMLEKKLLFLTNAQCSLFNRDLMEKAITALQLNDAMCIIRLIASHGTAQDYRVHIERRDQPAGQYEGTSVQFGSELNAKDSYIMQKQLVLFFKNCLIPLAKKTKALIVLNAADDCCLTAALERVVLPELERLGGSCPFTILGWGQASKYLYKSVKNQGLCGKMAISTREEAFIRGLKRLTKLYKDKGVDENELERCDLTKAATHFIIFEGVDIDDSSGKTLQQCHNDGPADKFRNLFLQTTAAHLPSLAVATTGHNEYNYERLAALCRRGIPTLLLDSRQRAFTTNKSSLDVSRMSDDAECTDLSKEAKQFPRVGEKDLELLHEDDDTLFSLKAKKILLKIAMDMLKRQMKAFNPYENADLLKKAKNPHENAEKEKKGPVVVNQHVVSDLAFLHTVIRSCERSNHKERRDDETLSKKIEEMKEAQSDGSNGNASRVPPELAIMATDFLTTKMSAMLTSAKLSHAEQWLVSPKPQYEYLKESCEEYIGRLAEEVESNGKNEKDEGRDLSMKQGSRATWSAIYDILESPYTYTASIYDIDKINTIFAIIAKINRLPENNSLEALITLQDAWDYFDIYSLLASRYKLIAKVSYFLLLINGIGLSLMAIGSYSGYLSASASQYSVLGLSLFASGMSIYLGFMNPTQRWMQLRGAALSIESNIWKFRARSCEYRCDPSGNSDEDVDKLLRDRIQEIKMNVLEGADIKGTSFFGRMVSPNKHGQHPTDRKAPFGVSSPSQSPSQKSKVAPEKNDSDSWGMVVPNKHGQYPTDKKAPFGGSSPSQSPSQKSREGYSLVVPVTPEYNSMDIEEFEKRVGHALELGSTTLNSPWQDLPTKSSTSPSMESGGTINNHYKPVLPEEYTIFRLEEAIKFYKKRIPHRYRVKYFSQFLIVAGGLTGVLFATFDLMLWSAILSITTGALTAWLEFTGTESKIVRYSTTVASLQDLLTWWRTRPAIERSTTAAIDNLVSRTEALLKDEESAWRSTSQADKLLNKETNDDKTKANTESRGGGSLESI